MNDRRGRAFGILAGISLSIVCQGGTCPVQSGAPLIGVAAAYDVSIYQGVTCSAVRVADGAPPAAAACVELGGAAAVAGWRSVLFNLCAAEGARGSCAGTLYPGEMIQALFTGVPLE